MSAADRPSLEAWLAEQKVLMRLFVHDLKNPISALSANLSYLEAVLEDADEDAKSALADCTIASCVLLHMADNLRTLARLEARDRGEVREVGLAQLVQSVLRRVSRLGSSGPGPRVEGEIPDVELRVDDASVAFALENLLFAAMQLTPPAGDVILRVAAEDERVRFEVVDDGPEVDTESKERIFEQIGRAHV